MKKFFYTLVILAMLLQPFMVPAQEAAAQGDEPQPQAPVGITRYAKPTANGDCTSWDSACDLKRALNDSASGDQIRAAAGTYKPDFWAELTDFTFVAWVYWNGGDDPAHPSRIFDFGTNTSLFMHLSPTSSPAGKPRFQIRISPTTQQIDYDTALPVGQWVHVAVTLQGDLGALYLNGATSAGSTGVITLNPNQVVGNNLWLGRSQWYNNDPTFGGKIDEVAIFNRALSQDEINTVISSGWNNIPGKMVALHLDEAPASNATQLYNSFENTYGGTLVTDNGAADKSAAGYSGNALFLDKVNDYVNLKPRRELAFNLKNGVALYGGYPVAGGDVRDLVNNVTTLSGDIGVTANINDNSFHVITSNQGIDATAVLDGFTITGGNASGVDMLGKGGGIFVYRSSPKLTNLKFQANRANKAGGGISNWESNPSISNSAFIQNFCNADGGGMYNIASNPTLDKVDFSLNSAVNGAGMFNDHSNPYIFNSTFKDNYTSGTTGRGGGMYNFWYSNPTLSIVTFTGNKAQWGGGMYNYDHSNVLVKSNSIFTNNEAKADGGGLLSDKNCITTLSQVEITGNKAVLGGGMANYGTEIKLDGVTLSQNTAAGKGGGLWNYLGSATLTNVTFSNNTVNAGTSSWGGGMYSENSKIKIENSTFQENLADGGGGLFTNGGGQDEVLNNVNFIKNQARLNGGGLHTFNGSSPVLTNGTFQENSIIGPIGVFGNGGGIYNIGSSLKMVGTQIISNTALARGGGMFNGNASANLTGVVFRGNTALLGTSGYGGGVYNSNSSPVLENVTFELNQAKVGGGMRNDANSKPALTNVDFISNHADSGGGMYNEASSPTLTTVTFESNDASFGGAMANGASSNPVITDALFTNNNASGPDGGGGILNYNSSPVITDTLFIANTSVSNGGAVVNTNSNPSFVRVAFNGNTAGGSGGGMYNTASNPDLSVVTFSGNTAAGSGGGMYNASSALQIIHSTFYTNTSVTGGGGVYINGCTQMSPAALTNVLFNANSTNDPGSDLDKGGGIYNNNCPAVLTNVTLVHNQAGSYGGGIYATGAPPVLQNSLLWGNTGAGTTSDAQFHSGTPSVPQNTTIQQSDSDPSPFIDSDGADDIPGTLDDNLHPTYPSGEIIDGGVENKLDLDGDYLMLDDVPLDLDGDSRIYADNDLDGLLDNLNDLDSDDKNQVDQGAYEAGCWAWHMKTGNEYLEDGRDYRYGFHYKVDQVSDPRTITQTLEAYALERANGNLDKARTSFEIAVGCSETTAQARQATRGILDAIWEKATGAMLQGNEEMVQILDVTNSQESVTAEINQLKKARDYYNEAVLGYLEPLASGDFDLLLETMTITATVTVSETKTGLIDLERLLMASSRKSLANLELAGRQFRNGQESDAQQTLDAAYNQAKAEMSLIYSLWPEAAESADYTALLHNLVDMERLAGYLAAGKNPLGYDLDYIPFNFVEGQEELSNYSQTKLIADDDLQDADTAFAAIGAQQQEADDDWEKMQLNLQAAETLYNNKLVVLCGGSGSVPDRQYCAGGDIQEQREVVENALLKVELVLQQMENQNALILIEQERVAKEKGIRYATAKLITDTGEELASYAKQEVETELKKSTMEGVGGILSGFMGGFSPMGVATPKGIGFGSRLFAGILGGVTAGLEWQSQNEKADKLADIAAAKERLYAKQQAVVQYAEGDIAQANSLALQKQYMLKFAELDIDLAIALNNLQKELAHLVNLHNQAEYALAELVKTQAFTVMLYGDPAGRALRVRNMEMAHATYEVALASAYEAGKALEYQLNQDITYDDTGPLTTLDDIYPLQDLFYLTQALGQMENAYDYEPPEEGTYQYVYLSLALGFEDTYEPDLGRIKTREEKFNEFIRSLPKQTVPGGCQQIVFSFQTSIEEGNNLGLWPYFYNDRIEYIQMRVYGTDLLYDDSRTSVDNIRLTQAGTSILRTADSKIAFNPPGEDELRFYNLNPKEITIDAAAGSTNLIPETDFGLRNRSVSATEWKIKIVGGVGASCNELKIDNIEDIRLYIKHQYYTLSSTPGAPAADEAPAVREYQPIPQALREESIDSPLHTEASARPAATSADTDLDGLFVGALAMTQPLYIPATELRIWLDDAGGSLTGHISPTLAIPAVSGTGKGPTLTGSWSGTSFSLQSETFVTSLAPGIPITHTIYLQEGIIASTEITRSLSGVYLEILEGLTLEPLENHGVFRMERPLRLLQAGFGASPRSVYVGDNVFFSDLSMGNPTSWSWNFGDGAPVSTVQNPVHAFAAIGDYDVSLTISDGSGSNTLTLVEYISVEPPGAAPQAGFIADPMSGTVGMTVHFYDQSTGGATSWLWTFGDGITSTLKNPTHTYNEVGVYTVSLKASNAFGQDTFTRVDYITVEEAGMKVFLPMIRR